MKLQLSHYEARQIVADKYNVSTLEVEIEAKPFTAAPVPPNLSNGISCPTVRHALFVLFNEPLVKAKGANKIELIRAIRTLTDCSLKDGKDFVEQELLREYPSF